MNTVKLQVIKDFEDGDLKFTKGQKIDVTKKTYTAYIKMGVAKVIKEKKIELIPDKETAIKENKKLAKLNKKTKPEKTEKSIEKNIKQINAKPIEPVLVNNTPKWLTMIEKTTIETTGKPIKEILEQPSLIEVIKIFGIEDEGMWKCNKCDAKIISNPKTPIWCTECNRKSTFKGITETIDTTLWRLPIWKDIPIENLDMQNTYLDLVNLIKDAVVFSDEIYYHILALWIIASWKQECWNSISFLIFRGLIESGKTRALEILRDLGYRMMHTAGTTFPALVRATHEYHAGVLLDEIDSKIDKRTESGRAMIDFLKESYKKGSYYRVADLDNQKKIKSYNNYGFKAFAGEKGGYDDAIFSRSIDFQMEQDYPEIDDLKDVTDEINRIKTILLNYRYKTNDPPELSDDLILKGRDREIFSCIIRTAMHIGIEYQNIIDFISQRKQEKEEDYQNTDEYQLLKAIKELEESPTLFDAPDSISYTDLAEHLGWDSDKRQKIGYIFKKKLQLKTKRGHVGSVVLLNDPKNSRKIKSYFRRFKI